MAHEITAVDGLALNRTKAWHGLGNVVNEDMSPTQALEVAGLNWTTVIPEVVTAKFTNGPELPVLKARPLYRAPSPTNSEYIELGTVGPTYTPIQNAQLADLAYEFGKEVKVESAGSIRQGQKVWFLLRGETFDMGGDITNSYMSLMNGNDGLSALSIYPTTVRVVCANTLSTSFAEAKAAKKIFKVAHTANSAERVKMVADAVRQFRSVEAVFANNMQALKRKEVKNEQAILGFWKNAADKLFPNFDAKDPRQGSKITKVIDSWQSTLQAEMLELGVDTPDMWLLANAVSNHLQHDKPGRVTDGWEDRRMESNFLGDNAQITDHIFRMALAY